MLDNQTVITGVSREVASLAAKAMGMVLDPSGGDAFSVGGFIFVFKNTADSGTIGHEGIHGIQSVVAGGTRQFLEHYNKASIIAGITREQVRKDTSGNDIVKQVGDRRINVAKAYFGNQYERAAYSFGPQNSTAEQYLPNGRKQIIGTW